MTSDRFLPMSVAAHVRSEPNVAGCSRKSGVEDNKVKPDYVHIRVPVVAIFRTMTKEEFLLEYPPRNAEERAAMDQAYAGAGGCWINGKPIFELEADSEDRRASRREPLHVPIERSGHHSRAARIRRQQCEVIWLLH